MSERLSDAELTDLLAKAEKATPGPWFIGWWGGRCTVEHKHDGKSCKYDPVRYADYTSEGTGIAACTAGVTVVGSSYDGAVISEPDAEHIVAANPATVAALVREVQEARKAIHDAMRLWDSGEDPASVLSNLRRETKAPLDD